ncbi:MAG: DUF928 domain-containing protein [Limnothrix sp.]
MNRQSLSFSSITILLGLQAVGFSSAIAATPQAEISSVAPQIELTQLPKPNVGSPSSTEGGGKRGGCISPEGKALFSPVLPADSVANTVSSSPSLWWNIPENDAVKAELSVFTQGNAEDSLVHYQVINDINEKSGLLQITLPDNALESNRSYWWDLTLACDEVDRSGDIFLFGSISRKNVDQVTLRRDSAVLDTLASTLMGTDSFLTLEATEAETLATSLQAGNVDTVESSLRGHFVGLQNDYAKLSQSILKLNQNPGVNAAELGDLKAQRGQMMLELAQLSAFFDMWGDTANYLAMSRSEHPEVWENLLSVLFPQDDPLTDEQEDDIIRVLRMSPNL